MQCTSVSFWLRIVSMRMAVLPVERSPMISSRWPRPTFVIASIDLMPVMSGSFTGWRSTTPGALNSSGRRSSVSIGPRPSSGLPSGSTTRPRSASPTGTLATRPVRRTGSPSLTCCHSPNSAAPTSSSSRLNARPTTSCSNSSISDATAFSSPYTRAMPSPISSTVPTSERSVWTSYCSIRDFRIWVISSGRSFTLSPCLASSGCRKVSAKSLEPTTNARVHAHRPGLEDDSADQLGIDAPRGVHGTARSLLDLADDRARLVVAELERGRQLHGQPPLLLRHEPLELSPDLAKLAAAALLDDQEQEVPDKPV